jgi:hypothetical protein
VEPIVPANKHSTVDDGIEPTSVIPLAITSLAIICGKACVLNEEAMASPPESIIETRRHQMFPILEPGEIERVRRFGEVRQSGIGCCARAASGQAAAAPRSVMSSRRFTAQCLHASTEKDSTTGGVCCGAGFQSAYDRLGSKAP